jgi:hypothetical protein
LADGVYSSEEKLFVKLGACLEKPIDIGFRRVHCDVVKNHIRSRKVLVG